MSQKKDGVPSVSRETQDYLVNHVNFENGNVPIYWGPSQDTTESYQKPSGFNTRGLMSVPELVRFVYSDLDFQPSTSECCKECRAITAMSGGNVDQPNVIQADEGESVRSLVWYFSYENRCYDSEGGFTVTSSGTVGEAFVNELFTDCDSEGFPVGVDCTVLSDIDINNDTAARRQDMQDAYDAAFEEGNCDNPNCIDLLDNEFVNADTSGHWLITYNKHVICPSTEVEITEGRVLTTDVTDCDDFPDLDCDLREEVTEDDLLELETEYNDRLDELEDEECM